MTETEIKQNSRPQKAGSMVNAGYILSIIAVLVAVFGLTSFSFSITLVLSIIIGGLLILAITLGYQLVSVKKDTDMTDHSTDGLIEKIREKDTLLKEVHHRVKNNLQTVCSLLNMQSRGAEDEHMKNLIKSSQNRVMAMAMVHEMLYLRDDLTAIDYKPYVFKLTEYLIKSVKGPDSKVKLAIDIPDIVLGIDTAIPLGLLINETITNSLKYGIKDDHEGEIHIELQKQGKDDYILTIGDNGIGISESVDPKTSKSLGLKLIHNLARQLKGSITMDWSRKGTNYIVRFKDIGHDPFHSIA